MKIGKPRLLEYMFGAMKTTTRCFALTVLLLTLPSVIYSQSSDEDDCEAPNAADRPEKVKVVPGNRQAVISWSFRENVCMQGFNVTATALSPVGEEQSSVSFSTSLMNTMVPELQNGVPYKFRVQAIFDDFVTSPATTVVATPFIPCNETDTPNPPENITAVAEGTSVTVCWSIPSSGGCTDEFRIGKRIVPTNDAEALGIQWEFFTAKFPGCMTIDDHEDRRSYQYLVQAYNSKTKSGEFTGVEVSIAADWRCVPIDKYYPVCAAAKTGTCKPMSCASIKENGMCDLPSLRKYDLATKSVIQYCANECECEEPSAEEVEKITKVTSMSASEAIEGDDFACCLYEE